MSGSPFGFLEYKASGNAADAQLDAANKATDIQLQMYNQSRADLAPWRDAGAGAINALWGGMSTPEGAISKEQFANKWSTAIGHPLNYQEKAYVDSQYEEYIKGNFTEQSTFTPGLIQKGPGEFKESPSYQFALSEGQKGIQRAASATGRLGSGSYIKDATKYAEGMASQEYGNFLDRYYKSLNPYLAVAGMGQIATGQQANINTNTGNSLANTYGNAGAAQAAGILGQYNSVANSMGNAGNQIGNYMMNQQGQNALTQNWGYSPAGQSYWGGTTAGSAAGVNSMVWL